MYDTLLRLRALFDFPAAYPIYQVCSRFFFLVQGGMQPYCELRNCTAALEPERLWLDAGIGLDLRFGFVIESALALQRLLVVVAIVVIVVALVVIVFSVVVVVVVVVISVVILVIGDGLKLLVLVGVGKLENWRVRKGLTRTIDGALLEASSQPPPRQ